MNISSQLQHSADHHINYGLTMATRIGINNQIHFLSTHDQCINNSYISKYNHIFIETCLGKFYLIIYLFLNKCHLVSNAVKVQIIVQIFLRPLYIIRIDTELQAPY